MYTCEVCGELLGDSVTTCFNCRNTIAKVEGKAPVGVKAPMEVKAPAEPVEPPYVYEQKIRYKYERKLEQYYKVLFGGIAVIVLFVFFLCIILQPDADFFEIILILLVIYYVILQLVFRVNFCPFCGAHFYRKYNVPRYCGTCGKRYRE